jgi:peptidylprolyl isomerase
MTRWIRLVLSLSLVILILSGCGMFNQNSAGSGNLITTESGLQYEDLVKGTGASPQNGQNVVVHYTGKLDDGSVFDSSLSRNQPFVFTLGVGQVIKGWDEGIASMQVGGKRRLVIPPKLGYGSQGAGGVIPPNATLDFEVELLGIQ